MVGVGAETHLTILQTIALIRALPNPGRLLIKIFMIFLFTHFFSKEIKKS